MNAPTATPTEPCRVLVACLPQDLSDTPLDGFVIRHRRMVETIAGRHPTALLCLRTPIDSVRTPSVEGVGEVFEVTLPEVVYAATRGSRLRTALRSCCNIESVSDRMIADAAAEARPDVVITVGPWLGAEYRGLFRRYPTMHLFEEDVLRDWGVGSKSAKGRAFRRVETWLYGRDRAQPEIVVTIGEHEVAPARRRYPRARHLFLPLTLSRASWPPFATRSEGDGVLVVGNLGQARNAEGLAAVLEELARRDDKGRIRLRLVSGRGLDPSLEPFLAAPWVEHVEQAQSLTELYRHAWASLVPAVRATGQKTTILQAWTCGCPVVCFDASAATMEAPDALLSGGTAAEVVDCLISLADDSTRRQKLVTAGFVALSHNFNPDREDERVLGAIDHLCGWPRDSEAQPRVS